MAKNKAKLARRLKIKAEEAEDPSKKEERLATNIPKTIENMREFDETIVNNDDEVFAEQESDEFAAYFQGLPPKMLVSTSKRPSAVSFLGIVLV